MIEATAQGGENGRGGGEAGEGAAVEGRAPRTPEQQEAVRRRSLPVAAGGVICGIIGLGWMLATPVGPLVPPNLYGANLAMCAMLMGVGILFYARGTPGTRGAAMMSVAAILLGLAGPVVFAVQTIHYRVLAEGQETGNVEAIANAARAYAGEHGGKYPADLLVLVEEQKLPLAALQSPFGKRHEFFDQFEDARKRMDRRELLDNLEKESDYIYLGADLKNPEALPAEMNKALIVAASNEAVMRTDLAIGFADGSSRFVSQEEVKGIMDKCNEARAKLGLGALRPPEIIEHALEEGAATTQQGAAP